MLIKKINIVLIIIILSSCNNKKVDTLQRSVFEKDSIIKRLNMKIKDLRVELKALNFENSKIRDYSDEQIIQIVKQEREFKCPRTPIKDFVIRKTNSDEYEVRFYQKFIDFDRINWRLAFVRIKILPNNKYSYKLIDGTYCQE